ncbi:hypothetical protein TNCV_4115521 [Trichonephila clavipes]|nr:hypothetical protein TNCV_4115521 [Trichonephila clavipes]
MALLVRWPRSVFVYYAGIGLGRSRETCDLPMKKDEDLSTCPWCLKTAYLGDESPGLRDLEQSPKEKRLRWWRTEIGMERKERPVALENLKRYTPVA